MAVGEDLRENLQRAIKLIRDATANNSSLIVLPECFNSPYGTKHFPKYAEPIPNGETSKTLSEEAKANKVFLVAGSIPEREGNKFYNTTTVWSPSGELLAKHRKIHLFDIDIPGGVRFKESDCLSAGKDLTTFNISNLKIGVGICYDLRFSELSKIYRKQGVDMLLYPGAFNMTTGPLHWELLLRARAVDEQVFVAGVSPARDTTADYVAWGHSMVVDPWGKILQQADSQEETVIVDLDLAEIDNVRKQIPVYYQRREDLYDTIEVKSKM
ncbi:omega-amidase NIT2 isoform X2 [Homalodisca vitripennis]|nr:omega-amidase NIT2 isoform X2 [Homalodisca vitripennis]